MTSNTRNSEKIIEALDASVTKIIKKHTKFVKTIDYYYGVLKSDDLEALGQLWPKFLLVKHSLIDMAAELPEDLINLPENAAQNTVIDIEEFRDSVRNDLYRYQNLNSVMESYREVTVTVKTRMNMRKNLPDLNKYLDTVEDNMSDWLTEHFLSGTAMNSIEVIRGELVVLIQAIEARNTAAATAAASQQPPGNVPPANSTQPYIVHEKFDPRDLPTFDGKETSYASFKQAFLERTSNIGMHSSRKKQLLARPDVMKDKLTREAIQNMEPEDQWAHLDRTFLSRSRQLMRIMKDNFCSPALSELDDKFVTAVNTLESQIVEMKQLTLKGESETPVDWLEFLIVAAFAGRCPTQAREDLGKVLGTSDLPKTDELREKLQQFRGLARLKTSEIIITAPKATPKAKGSVQTAQGTAATPAAAADDLPCLNPSCDERHRIQNCEKWINMSVPDRKQALKSAYKCFFCLQPNHSVESCPKKDTWKPCKKNGCGQFHHWTLHESMATHSV